MLSPFRFRNDLICIKRRAACVYVSSRLVRTLIKPYLISALKLKTGVLSKNKPYLTFENFKIFGFNADTLVYLYRDVFLSGTYFFKTNILNPVIIDCGANIGMSVLFFKWLYPNSIIYAFEPSPSIFEMLQKNISANKLENVFCYNVALADKTATVQFFEPDGIAGSLTGSLSHERNDGTPVEVQAMPLSAFIRENNITSIDYLKMDIEGAETAVINEMAAAQTMDLIKQAGIEYHHQIAGQNASLGHFLKTVELAGFYYSLFAEGQPSKTGEMQDVHLFLNKQQKGL